ncbi:phage tail assembly chaperone, partial [Escherichia coli]|uniref:phage tail assembly chaperone n=1 Tax=Escherichia coli TaxID=562 RepID=UPI0025789D83
MRKGGGGGGGVWEGAWYVWQSVQSGMEEDNSPRGGGEKPRRNLEADVTLFCDVLCDTDLQRVFTPD